MIAEQFIILAVLIHVIGTIGYMIDTLKGITKPNKVTWFLWALFPMIAFAAMLDKGAELPALIMVFMAGFMPLMVFCSSFINKKAFWKITRFDYICGFLSVFGLCLWLITREGNIAIIFSIIADGLALLPTLVKSYKFPETESWLLFSNVAISSAIVLLIIKDWTFASVAFPIYGFFACSTLFILIRFEVGPRLRSI